MAQSVYDFTCTTLAGEQQPLSAYQGKPLLIVNTASKCGLTPQYEGLEKPYQTYRDQGLEILGFPCNQFLKQEPGSEKEIGEFCSTKYDVSFPLFGKIDVNGPDTSPLYEYLKRAAPGLLGSRRIKWNFTKFLIGADGSFINRYEPTITPEDLVPEIEAALKKVQS